MSSVSAAPASWQSPDDGLTSEPDEVNAILAEGAEARPYTHPMATGFLERLRTGDPIVADGGMGALLSAAVPRLRCPEEACLRAPEAVVSLHVEFINAGAEVIQANTFGANRRKLSQPFLDDAFESINSTAVKLAREAREITGRDIFIAGSIGPIGEATSTRVRRDLFAEQAELLEGRGADLLMVETFSDLEELADAIEAIGAVSGLPTVALLSFDESAETLAGVTASEAAARLASLGVAAIGANHGAGLLAALAALAEMRDSGMPLAALPNLSLASLAGERVVFPHSRPDYFGEFAAHARDLGARLIGGCCGTTPAEIAAIRAVVDGQRAPRTALVFSERELVASLGEDQLETGLGRALRSGEWVVSVQLDPPLGGSSGGMIEVARALRAAPSVHFADINDNPAARARMNGLMAAVAIEREAGLETIPHLTPRDMTLAGLESVLLGAHAEGIRNVLAVTGDPPEETDGAGRGVYQVDSIGLVELIAQLNRGEDVNGRSIDAPTSFFPGVAVNPSAEDLEQELERFRRKVAAGARFAMTQVLFDLSYLDRFLEHLGGTSPVPLLVGLWPLWSHQLAVRVHDNVPGIVVPERVQRALLDAGPSAADTGMRIARELYVEAREKAAGVYVVAPFKRPLAALDVIV
jgi:methionine synthase I (cobalamin-dependent)/5,10-methylenetetrahydrofolate reductase